MDNENLGAVVAALRGEMSQGELAQKMTERGHDWQQVTVSRLERGIRALKLFEAVDLAAVLGVSLDELMDTANNRAGSAQDRARLAKAKNDLRIAHTNTTLAVTELLDMRAALGTIQEEIGETPDIKQALGDYNLWSVLVQVVSRAGDRGLIEGISSDLLSTEEGRRETRIAINDIMGVDLYERPLT